MLAFRKMTAAAIIVGFAILGELSMAQDTEPSATVKSPEVIRLEEELQRATLENQRIVQEQAQRTARATADKTIAEAEKAVAEANKAKIEAILPTSETKGKGGEVAIADSAGYYSEILAYDSLESAAQQIAGKIANDVKNKDVILVDTLDFSSEVALLKLIDTRLKGIEAQLIALKSNNEIQNAAAENGFANGNESPLALAAAVPQVLGAAADIAAFFQTKIDVKKRVVDLNAYALTGLLAREVKTKAKSVIIPKLNLDTASIVNDTFFNVAKLRGEIADLSLTISVNAAKHKRSLEREKLSREKELADANAILAQLKKDGKDTAQAEQNVKGAQVQLEASENDLSELEAKRELLIGRLDNAVTSTVALLESLTTANTAGITPLQSVSNVDFIKNKSGALILFAEIASQGGEVETSQSTFSQGRASYLGGAVVAFVLAENNGTFVNGGAETKICASTFKRKILSTGIAEHRAEIAEGKACKPYDLSE